MTDLIKTMRHRVLAFSGTAILIAGLGAACTGWATGKTPAVQYPKELLGFWVFEQHSCPEEDASYETNSFMDISSGALHAYEDRSKPTQVELISSQPMAWRIESLIDIGPSGIYERDSPSIFVLGNYMLTVTTEYQSEVYKRCGSVKTIPTKRG